MKNPINSSGIFETNSPEIEKSFIHLIKKANISSSNFKIDYEIRHITSLENSYQANKAACDLIQSGVWAFYSSKSNQLSWILDSYADYFNIPYFNINSLSAFKNKNFTFNLNIDQNFLTDAISSILTKKTQFIFFYQNFEDLIFYKDLLKNNYDLKFVLINQDEIIPNVLEQSKIAGETQFIIALSLKKTEKFLFQALKMGMITEYHRYYLINLDASLLNLSLFENLNKNFTWFNLQKIIYTEQKTLDYYLMKDAVNLYLDAIRQLVKESTKIYPPKTNKTLCSSLFKNSIEDLSTKYKWKSGERLLNKLKQIKFFGQTGIIKFNSSNKRDSLDLEIKRLTKKKIEKIGDWNNLVGVKIFNFDTNLTLEVSKKVFKIGVLDLEPFAFLDERTPAQWPLKHRLKGIYIDLIELLHKEIKFKDYELYLINREEYFSNFYNFLNEKYFRKYRNQDINFGLMEENFDFVIGELIDSNQIYPKKLPAQPFFTLSIVALFIEETLCDSFDNIKSLKNSNFYSNFDNYFCSNHFALYQPIFKVFDFDLWLSLVVCYIFVSFLVYFIINFGQNNTNNLIDSLSKCEKKNNQFKKTLNKLNKKSKNSKKIIKENQIKENTKEQNKIYEYYDENIAISNINNQKQLIICDEDLSLVELNMNNLNNQSDESIILDENQLIDNLSKNQLNILQISQLEPSFKQKTIIESIPTQNIILNQDINILNENEIIQSSFNNLNNTRILNRNFNSTIDSSLFQIQNNSQFIPLYFNKNKTDENILENSSTNNFSIVGFELVDEQLNKNYQDTIYQNNIYQENENISFINKNLNDSEKLNFLNSFVVQNTSKNIENSIPEKLIKFPLTKQENLSKTNQANISLLNLKNNSIEYKLNENYNLKPINLSTCFWYTFAVACHQKTLFKRSSFSICFISSIWRFFTIIIFCIFTANLTAYLNKIAFLSTHSFPLIPASLKPEIQFVCSWPTCNLIQSSKNQFMQQINDKIYKINSDQGKKVFLERLIQGNTIYLTNEFEANYLKSKFCNLTIMKLNEKFLGLDLIKYNSLNDKNDQFELQLENKEKNIKSTFKSLNKIDFKKSYFHKLIDLLMNKKVNEDKKPNKFKNKVYNFDSNSLIQNFGLTFQFQSPYHQVFEQKIITLKEKNLIASLLYKWKKLTSPCNSKENFNSWFSFNSHNLDDQYLHNNRPIPVDGNIEKFKNSENNLKANHFRTNLKFDQSYCATEDKSNSWINSLLNKFFKITNCSFSDEKNPWLKRIIFLLALGLSISCLMVLIEIFISIVTNKDKNLKKNNQTMLANNNLSTFPQNSCLNTDVKNENNKNVDDSISTINKFENSIVSTNNSSNIPSLIIHQNCQVDKNLLNTNFENTMNMSVTNDYNQKNPNRPQHFTFISEPLDEISIETNDGHVLSYQLNDSHQKYINFNLEHQKKASLKAIVYSNQLESSI
uniref:Glutamate receptor ionotropic kainate-3 like protein n=1 Tax=Polyphagotarsonemus latus TaxID=1204166 RepID=A0AAN0N6H5_9ACAR